MKNPKITKRFPQYLNSQWKYILIDRCPKRLNITFNHLSGRKLSKHTWWTLPGKSVLNLQLPIHKSTMPTHLVCDHSWHLSHCRALWLEWTLLQHTVHRCWMGSGLGDTSLTSWSKKSPAIPECQHINGHWSGRTSSHENIMLNKNGHKSHRTAPSPSSQQNLITTTQHNIKFSSHQWWHETCKREIHNTKPQSSAKSLVVPLLEMPPYHNVSAQC